ncbi:MAG: hypothetical protein JO061_10235 [Acidobacteriaceae bacterium]|nr:hypothetical protein [Acidobacteriaceae bacterium]
MSEAFGLVIIGLGAGALGLMLLSRFVAGMLHGVSPFDPLTLLSVVLTLIVVSFVAALLPALRAAAIDPIKALRVDF